MIHETLIRLYDAFILGMTIAAMTSTLIDYCKTIPPDVPNPPKMGRIPEL